MLGLLLGVIGVSNGNGSGMTRIQIVTGSTVVRRWKLVVMHCWAAASESIEARYERRVVFEAVILKFKLSKLFWPTVWLNCSSDLKIFGNSRTGNGSERTGIQIVAGSIVGWRWKLVVMHCWAAASESIEARYKWHVVFEAVISKFNGILLSKLLWPAVRKNCSCDREKLLKAENFARFLRLLEQFIQTVKGQNNFW